MTTSTDLFVRSKHIPECRERLHRASIVAAASKRGSQERLNALMEARDATDAMLIALAMPWTAPFRWHRLHVTDDGTGVGVACYVNYPTELTWNQILWRYDPDYAAMVKFALGWLGWALKSLGRLA